MIDDQYLFDKRGIIKNAMYECSECKAVVAGRDLDWFKDEPDMYICPVCNNRCGFTKVEGASPPPKFYLTITDKNYITTHEFIVSRQDAQKISDGFSTEWMDDDELNVYLEEGA